MSLLDDPRVRPADHAPAPLAPPSRRRRWPGLVVGAACLAAAAWALVPYAVTVEPPAVSLPPEAGLEVPGYGPSGTYALNYRYGETVTLTIPLANASAVPWRITSVELVEPAYPLLEPVSGLAGPVDLSPFEETSAELVLEFSNCRYYHERANNTYDQVRVSGSVLGREVTRTVRLATPLVVHSQVILNCPERTFERYDDRRR